MGSPECSCTRCARYYSGRLKLTDVKETFVLMRDRRMRQFVRNNTILRRLYYRARLLQPNSEADERQILGRLTQGAPKTFVEFGFHPIEFNCVEFARNPSWSGLLIDASKKKVEDAKGFWPSRLEF